jgi:hypothetical protein
MLYYFDSYNIVQEILGCLYNKPWYSNNIEFVRLYLNLYMYMNMFINIIFMKMFEI